MVNHRARPLAVLLLAASAQFSPAQAQDSAGQPGGDDRPLSTVGGDYASQCRLNGVRCTLVYGDDTENSKTARSTTTPPSRPLIAPREAVIDGPLAVILVLVAMVVIIGLVMRFGNGGVLLSSAPRDVTKRQGEAPESWRISLPEAEERPGDFLQRVADMEDRRQALVLLLRHCLLHAADVTGTRLFRSDTERAVFARLPDHMPDRERLENLLTETELVHYGGRPVAESHFGALLVSARSLLSIGRLSHA